jgi:hypothetical protein
MRDRLGMLDSTASFQYNDYELDVVPRMCQIAVDVFRLFKKRTDGRNTGLNDIHPGNMHKFHFKGKGITDIQLSEACQYLILRNLIIPSLHAFLGHYRLTSVGIRREPEDLLTGIVDAHLLAELGQHFDSELSTSCLGKSHEDAVTSAFRILEERIREDQRESRLVRFSLDGQSVQQRSRTTGIR